MNVKKNILFLFYISIFFLHLCCSSNNTSLENECKQGIGEACNKLGKSIESQNREEAIKLYRRACSLENTNGCVRLADLIKKENKQEALEVLRYSCKRGNTSACAKQAELMSQEHVL